MYQIVLLVLLLLLKEKFEIVDDLTIRISTKKPNPFIPNDMSRIAIID